MTSPTPQTVSLLNAPNVLCAIRLVASPFVIVLAWAELPMWCLALTVALFVTDWIDGKLARWFNQQTTFGARLDTLADVTFYACVALALVVSRWEVVWQEVLWVFLAIGSYMLSVMAALIKFGRAPSYHTQLAKTSWLLMLIGVVTVLLDWSVWPLRIAMLGVLLTNLEATLITFVLPSWRADVLSVFHARRVEEKR